MTTTTNSDDGGDDDDDDNNNDGRDGGCSGGQVDVVDDGTQANLIYDGEFILNQSKNNELDNDII